MSHGPVKIPHREPAADCHRRVELVHAATAAFNARDWDQLGDLLTSDIEVRPATALFAPSVRGWLAVRAFWQDLAATMQGAALVGLQTGRGRVLAAIELSSSGPASGITLQQCYFGVVTVRDGKIALWSTSWTRRTRAGQPA
jgi:hypothetical protein